MHRFVHPQLLWGIVLFAILIIIVLIRKTPKQ
jgi:hypothetical protein